MNKLHKQYEEREEKIKEKWLKHHERPHYGIIAGVECRKLWDEFVVEAKKIAKKYGQDAEE